MGMRIAVGSGKCSDFAQSPNPRLRELCRRIHDRIEHLASLSQSLLIALPGSSTDLERIDSQDVTFTTYREETSPGRHLVVVQGFLPSWRLPRYFGPAGVGFMLAEGLVVTVGGTTAPATDDLLWEFR